MRFWQRTTKLNIGQAGGKGISLSNIAGNGLTVDFDIIKDSTTKTNKATFKIYNLSTMQIWIYMFFIICNKT